MSIDNLKSIIGKRQGLAKANRFLVIFTPPSQALVNLDPFDIIGRLANKTFNKKSFVSDPRDIAFLCESTQMPGRNINPNPKPQTPNPKPLIDFFRFNFIIHVYQ